MTAPTPPPLHTSPILPVQRGLHDCHSLLSPSPHAPPHCPTHTYHPTPPPHPYTHRHRSASQNCVDCTTVWPVSVCAAPSCVEVSGVPWLGVPEDCSVYFWEPLHRQCPRDVFNSSAGAYDWVVNMALSALMV